MATSFSGPAAAVRNALLPCCANWKVDVDTWGNQLETLAWVSRPCLAGADHLRPAAKRLRVVEGGSRQCPIETIAQRIK